MNDRLPFATGEARLRLLYELPMSGKERRVLVVGAPGSAGLVLHADLQVRITDLHELAPASSWPGGQGYEAVLLPGSLFEATAPSAEFCLRQAFVTLKPGGVLVGHCENLSSVREYRSACRAIGQPTHWRDRRVAGSALRLQATLQMLGFLSAECFYVEPQISSPMALVPANPGAAKSHFVRTVWRNRPLYGNLGFVLRLGLAKAGLGGSLQPHLFFWARKPC